MWCLVGKDTVSACKLCIFLGVVSSGNQRARQKHILLHPCHCVVQFLLLAVRYVVSASAGDLGLCLFGLHSQFLRDVTYD